MAKNLTAEGFADKLDRRLKDIKSGVLGEYLSLVAVIMQQSITWYRVADAVAGTDYVFAGWEVPFDCKIIEAKFHPHAALTANDSNYSTVTIETVEGTPDVKATVVTTATGGTGDWVLNVEEEFTIGDALLSDGDTVALASTKTGTGVAVPAGVVQLFVVPR